MNTLDIVTGLLLTIWAVGFFGLSAGIFIHLFLLLAAITVIIRITTEKTELGNKE
jgi:hypothetical protein